MSTLTKYSDLKKNDISFSKSVSFNILALEGLLTLLLWFSLSESCEQVSDFLLSFF